jgi:hypothetical protein
LMGADMFDVVRNKRRCGKFLDGALCRVKIWVGTADNPKQFQGESPRHPR